MTKSLTNCLPIWEVAADHIVTKMGDTTMAFRLVKPEIFTLSKEELKNMLRYWVKALQVLLPGTIVHIQDWYWEARCRN